MIHCVVVLRLSNNVLSWWQACFVAIFQQLDKDETNSGQPVFFSLFCCFRYSSIAAPCFTHLSFYKIFRNQIIPSMHNSLHKSDMSIRARLLVFHEEDIVFCLGKVGGWTICGQCKDLENKEDKQRLLLL